MTNSLTIFTGVLLEDKMPELDSESALKARFRIKKLKKLLRKKQKSFQRTKNKLQSMQKEFNKHNKEELERLLALEEQISVLCAHLKLLEIEEGDANDVDREIKIKELEEELASFFAGEQNSEDGEGESDPSEEDDELSQQIREAKSLYRKIAGAWGPGRAENRQQVDWFIEATIAYKARDIATLQHLCKILKFGIEAVLASDLLYEIEKLELEIKELDEQNEEDHADLLRVYRIYINGNYGHMKALQASRRVIENKIRTAEYRAATLDSQIAELLRMRRAREKTIEDPDDPFASVEPAIGFWKF